jgi:hypothetical protein
MLGEGQRPPDWRSLGEGLGPVRIGEGRGPVRVGGELGSLGLDQPITTMSPGEVRVGGELGQKRIGEGISIPAKQARARQATGAISTPVALPDAVEQLDAQAREGDPFLARLIRDPAAVAAWLALPLMLITFLVGLVTLLLGHQSITINVKNVIEQCVQHLPRP